MQSTAISYVISARAFDVTAECQFELDVPARALSHNDVFLDLALRFSV